MLSNLRTSPISPSWLVYLAEYITTENSHSTASSQQGLFPEMGTGLFFNSLLISSRVRSIYKHPAHSVRHHESTPSHSLIENPIFAQPNCHPPIMRFFILTAAALSTTTAFLCPVPVIPLPLGPSNACCRQLKPIPGAGAVNPAGGDVFLGISCMCNEDFVRD